jgi:hypothetical protein
MGSIDAAFIRLRVKAWAAKKLPPENVTINYRMLENGCAAA